MMCTMPVTIFVTRRRRRIMTRSATTVAYGVSMVYLLLRVIAKKAAKK